MKPSSGYEEELSRLKKGVRIRYEDGRIDAVIQEDPNPGETLLKVQVQKVLSPEQISKWHETWELKHVIYAIQRGDYKIINDI